jgi:hypothetical protein
MQRIVTEDFMAIPIYINPFVHAVGPRVLPAGNAPAGEGFLTSIGRCRRPPIPTHGQNGR